MDTIIEKSPSPGSTSEKPLVASAVKEKPPLAGGSPNVRRRKLNRASPVSSRRYSAPPVRRARTFDSTSTTSEVREDPEEILRTIEGNGQLASDEKCGCIRKRSTSSKELSSSGSFQCDSMLPPTDIAKSRRQEYLKKRRSTFATVRQGNSATLCQCRSHQGALKPCKCSARRQTVSPKISESELMEKETRLVVLEFLRGLSPEQLSARKRRSREGSVSSRKSAQEIIEDLVPVSPSHANEYEVDEMFSSSSDYKKTEKKKRPESQKYNTVTIGEHDHQKLLEMLACSGDSTNSTGVRLGRSRSDISEERYATTRAKIQKLQAPVKKWIQVNSTLPRVLKRDIVNFKKSNLKSHQAQAQIVFEGQSAEKVKKKTLMERKNLQPLSLKIPPQRLPSSVPPPTENEISDIDIFTPETYAVNRLEEISEDIMRDFPGLLQIPISDLITVAENGESVNYDIFSNIAKPVYDLKLPKFGNVWSRVALVLYMVRETVFLGNLNDRQLELLVEHSTKFFTENAKESVEKEGGWESALGDQMFFANGMAFDEFDSSDEDPTRECPNHCYHRNHEEDTPDGPVDKENMKPTNTSLISSTVKDWSTYGVVVVSLALGLAYSLLK